MELYAGAAGKVLLAYAPQKITQSIMEAGPLKKITANTIVSKSELLRQLTLIRKRGYSVSEGERAKDVWSVAAPVFDHRGMIVCSIGVTGPVYRIPQNVQSNFIDTVVEKARELTRHLGGSEYHYEKEDHHDK